ncbi:hypothetical protein [Planococcus lenghuensis]|uniref:Zorya protein ZorC EH domain-containing protein n=1 Tax=Planococcus lenghuensis TaxID=2213202 RepID=A0A1Q2KWS1_9BACL|nr:hypothetical protein [Planococcus lenghuensis]AQQ52257.1 hypothetical protein B0X71_03435 [Planococcus lenghuensis]
MNFVYKPVFITEWVEKEIKHRRLLNLDTAEFRAQLSELKKQLEVVLQKTFKEFCDWLVKLPSKLLKIFPFLLPVIKEEIKAVYAVEHLLERVGRDAALFDYALYACYLDNEFQASWTIVQKSYETNRRTITSGWTNRKIQFWDEFILLKEQHAQFVLQQTKLQLSFGDILDYLMVQENQKFYHSLLIELFSNGQPTLYREQKAKFIELFEGADNFKQQRLAGGFIRSELLYELEEISHTIYRYMGTYRRQEKKWIHIDQSEKIAFHAWYISKELDRFFGNIGDNHERAHYWKKFSSRVKRHVIINHSSEKTILMYFDDVVVMEVFGTGAVYFYDVSVFENYHGEKVKRYEEAKQLISGQVYVRDSARITRRELMDTSLTIAKEKLIHGGGWQYKFDYFLRSRLGWEVNENEIIRNRQSFSSQ